MDLHVFWQSLVDLLVKSGFRLIGIVAFAFLAMVAIRIIIGRVVKTVSDHRPDIESRKRVATLGAIVRYTVRITIIVIALIMILDEFGIQIGPILAAAGVVGVAVGFGAQHLVQDIISGFFILFEDQIREGDVIQTVGKSGLVEKVNLRMVILRDLYGNVHFIRNGSIDTVTNMTKGFSYAVLDVGVAYREKVDEVVDVIREIDSEMRAESELAQKILEPVEILGLNEFKDSSMIIRARIKTKPIEQWSIGREFNRRLKSKFDERNIEIPFPHITLYLGEDKEGHSSTFNVSLGEKAKA